MRALEGSDARALATFPPPPRGARAPLVLRNPWWAQPFEVFTRLVGMPSASGADPSVLLALAVPLMFGYMFGDVGQGLGDDDVDYWRSFLTCKLRHADRRLTESRCRHIATLDPTDTGIDSSTRLQVAQSGTAMTAPPVR